MGSSIVFTGPVEDTNGVYSFTAAIIAHTDGSVEAVPTPFDIDGWVFMVLTNPGATAPQAAYGLTLKDGEGIDIMGGTLAGRSATASEQAFPQLGTDAPGERYVPGTLTLGMADNNVNGALVGVTVFFKRKS